MSKDLCLMKMGSYKLAGILMRKKENNSSKSEKKTIIFLIMCKNHGKTF